VAPFCKIGGRAAQIRFIPTLDIGFDAHAQIAEDFAQVAPDFMSRRVGSRRRAQRIEPDTDADSGGRRALDIGHAVAD
jgi:hypothetical protein